MSPPGDSVALGVPSVTLGLLGGFELKIASELVQVAGHAQRLLALLAIRCGPVSRDSIVRLLWPEILESQAKARLRSVLWRLAECHRDRVLDFSGSTLALAQDVCVDFHTATELAERLVDRSVYFDEEELRTVALAGLTGDLLPHLCDEYWLSPDQERFHQLRLHALEALCDRLADIGYYSAAVDAGLVAVCADPLRESSRYAVIRAFLLEGNVSDALQQFASYQASLREELGIEPSQRLADLISAITPGAPRSPGRRL